jgi:hypothetical protein
MVIIDKYVKFSAGSGACKFVFKAATVALGTMSFSLVRML